MVKKCRKLKWFLEVGAEILIFLMLGLRESHVVVFFHWTGFSETDDDFDPSE